MNFRYTLIKLSHLQGKEETKGATGRDVLAAQHAKELKIAIAILKAVDYQVEYDPTLDRYKVTKEVNGWKYEGLSSNLSYAVAYLQQQINKKLSTPTP